LRHCYEFATSLPGTAFFVYLDGESYDGHMWFSSPPEEHR
jgi:hypothetical protein